MAVPESGAVTMEKVSQLVEDVSVTERRYAREYAAQMIVGQTGDPQSFAEERFFLMMATQMLSAKLEADKWEPLFFSLKS